MVVYAGSATSSATRLVLASITHATLLIDEAAQASEPECIIPMQQLDGNQNRTILCGDHHQLPPVCSVPGMRERWQLSLFERLYNCPGIPSVMLDEQYRMLPAIAMWPSEHFYGNELKTAAHLLSANNLVQGFPWPEACGVAFVDVEGEESMVGNSRRNKGEARLIQSIVADLLSSGDVDAADIAVLTPYDAQRSLLRDMMPRQRYGPLFIDSVDQAQGSEAAIVVLSTVRCNRAAALGFVTDARRLNVGITRAKRGLIVTGSLKTLWCGDIQSCWGSFIQFLTSHRLVMDASLRPVSQQSFDECMSLPKKTEISKDEACDARVQSTEKLGNGGPCLSLVELQSLLRGAQSAMRSLVASPLFVFGLNWMQQLPEHRYKVAEIPVDPIDMDQKAWSHMGEVTKIGVGRDAGNWNYYLVVTCWAHSIVSLLAHWSRLRSFLTQEIAATGVLPTLSRQNAAGDIVESVNGLFHSQNPKARKMQASLGISADDARGVNGLLQHVVQQVALYARYSGAAPAMQIQDVIEASEKTELEFDFHDPFGCASLDWVRSPVARDMHALPHPADPKNAASVAAMGDGSPAASWDSTAATPVARGSACAEHLRAPSVAARNETQPNVMSDQTLPSNHGPTVSDVSK